MRVKKLFKNITEVILHLFVDDFLWRNEANSGSCLTNSTAKKRGKQQEKNKINIFKQFLRVCLNFIWKVL